jgi:hypothetical protein
MPTRRTHTTNANQASLFATSSETAFEDLPVASPEHFTNCRAAEKKSWTERALATPAANLEKAVNRLEELLEQQTALTDTKARIAAFRETFAAVNRLNTLMEQKDRANREGKEVYSETRRLCLDNSFAKMFNLALPKSLWVREEGGASVVTKKAPKEGQVEKILRALKLLQTFTREQVDKEPDAGNKKVLSQAVDALEKLHAIADQHLEPTVVAYLKDETNQHAQCIVSDLQEPNGRGSGRG